MDLFDRDGISILKYIEKKSYLKRLISFLIGVFLIALSYNIFLAPNNLVPGGVGGLAIIINRYAPISDSLLIFCFNIFLVLLSALLLEDEKTKATILGATLFPLLVNFTVHINDYLKISNNDLLLSAIFGGVLFGFGAGLVFKAGFTTGGTDIINQITSKYFHISMGRSMLITDGFIVLLSVVAFDITHLMYSIIVLYIISLMSDRVILGISDSKAFYIITEKDKEVKEYITKYLGHGVTTFKAKGGFKKENRDVIMCVLPTKEYYRLKEGLTGIDPDSFFVVTDAYEVFGGE